MPNKFEIYANEYLSRKTIGYYNRCYTGFQQPDNPDFLNTLKNTFNKETVNDLEIAREEVRYIVDADIEIIMREHMLSRCLCVCVPRAKALNTYTNTQLMFIEAVSYGIATINYEYETYESDDEGNVINVGELVIDDGTENCIKRIKNARTTHLPEKTGRATKTGQVYENDGYLPYPGITKATCQINTSRIRGQNIILVDDIYTKNVNIDEDCIQALYDNGARSVIFYAIGYTRRL